MSVRIVYQDIAAGADEDALVSAQGASEFSDVSLLPFGSDHAPIATLAPGSWLLDGSREILNQQPIGFWSEAMSGADGQFSESGADGQFSDPPGITITFDKRYTSPGLYLAFDPAAGECCGSVTVQWFQGAAKLYEGTYYPDGAEYFCAHTAEAYDKVVARLNSTSIPYRYAKLSKIMFGVSRTFHREELRNVRATQEVSIISSEVAVNTLDFTLDSETDVEYMFQLKQPVFSYDGQILIGVFYISDSKRRGKGLYDVSCEDAIGVLDGEPYPARMCTNVPAKELIEDILGGHFDLELDPVLTAATVTGYLPDGTRRQALQQVAFALTAMVDTSGSKAVRVYKDREASPQKIPENRLYTGGTVDRSAIVTAVRVLAHSYSTTGEGNDTVEVNGTVYYHTSTAITISNPNVTASDKQNVVEVKDATLVNSGNAAAVAQHLYNYYSKRDRQKIRLVMNGEKPGDHIAAATPWGTVMDGYISSMHIALSGIAAAECEVVGTDVKSVGDPEKRMSGEFMAGAI